MQVALQILLSLVLKEQLAKFRILIALQVQNEETQADSLVYGCSLIPSPGPTSDANPWEWVLENMWPILSVNSSTDNVWP